MIKRVLMALSCFALVAIAAEERTMADVQAELKSKAPQEYQEIIKLAETDIFSASMKMMQLAREKGVAMPEKFGRRRGGERGGEMGGMGHHGEMGGMGRGGDGNFPGGKEGRGGRRRGERGGSLKMISAIKTASAIKTQFPEEYNAVLKDLSAVEVRYEALAVRAGAETTATEPMNRSLRKLQEKCPAEFDAAAELVKVNMREAVTKLMALAEREGIQLKLGGNRGGGGEHAAFSSAQERMNPAMRMRKLRERFPKEMQEFDELRRSDPAAARKLLQKLNQRYSESGN